MINVIEVNKCIISDFFFTVKVGGMRVVTHQKNEKVDGATPPPTKEEIEEFGDGSVFFRVF